MDTTLQTYLNQLPSCTRCIEKRLICKQSEFDRCNNCDKLNLECFVKDGDTQVSKEYLFRLVQKIELVDSVVKGEVQSKDLKIDGVLSDHSLLFGDYYVEEEGVPKVEIENCKEIVLQYLNIKNSKFGQLITSNELTRNLTNLIAVSVKFRYKFKSSSNVNGNLNLNSKFINEQNCVELLLLVIYYSFNDISKIFYLNNWLILLLLDLYNGNDGNNDEIIKIILIQSLKIEIKICKWKKLPIIKEFSNVFSDQQHFLDEETTSLLLTNNVIEELYNKNSFNLKNALMLLNKILVNDKTDYLNIYYCLKPVFDRNFIEVINKKQFFIENIENLLSLFKKKSNCYDFFDEFEIYLIMKDYSTFKSDFNRDLVLTVAKGLNDFFYNEIIKLL